MCDLSATSSLTEQDIAEITAHARALPGDWSVFPHVNFSGEVILLLNPAAWEEADKAILLRRDPTGIRVLLSEGDQLFLRATVAGAAAAVEAAWRATGWDVPARQWRVA